MSFEERLEEAKRLEYEWNMYEAYNLLEGLLETTESNQKVNMIKCHNFLSLLILRYNYTMMLPKAEKYIIEALRLSRLEPQDKIGEGMALLGLARLTGLKGEEAEMGQEYLEKAQEIFQKEKYTEGILYGLLEEGI